MGISTYLTQILQGPCSDNLWRYAIFWSIEREKNGIFTWGDGYIKIMMEGSQMGNLCASPILSCGKNYPFCPVEAALLKMSTHSYHVGEGIIGKVALTGRHSCISASELCLASMYKYHEDWKLHFAAGIKTVLLVPVLPYGVLQLGSLDTTFESSALAALIRDLFYKLYDDSVSHYSSTIGSGLTGHSHTLKQLTQTLPIDPPDVVANDLIDMMESSAQLLTTGNLNLRHPLTALEFPTFEDVAIGDRTSPLDLPDGLLDYENFDGFTLTDIAYGYQEHTHVSTTLLNNDFVISNSSIHSEFHKDLEAMSREEHELLMWHSRFNQQDTNHTLLQMNGNSDDFCLHLETNDSAELLFDTITNQVGHASRSNLSHSTDSSYSRLDLNESSVPGLPDGQELSPTSMYEGVMSSSMTETSPLEIDKNVTEECIGHMGQDALRLSSTEIKRRCRKVELHRSRPRDRQLIQDRMKDLRELIPNASKCSIDALLDKTVTYMQFLQSVSEKAEKIHNTLDAEELRDDIKKQHESFPLRAEELDWPGHLLIEMLCEDYELFLDMAHVLKGLEVNILKGVLEHRSNKPWARFVVEASEGFNQMQILCPMMHLLSRR